MPWTKLTAGNDWGSRYVLIGERHMSEMGTWGIGNENREDGTPILTAGKYRARFPNGHEEEVTVEMREYQTTVGDMGHDYSVRGLDPVVVMEVHGVKVDVDPMSLGVEIWRD